MSRKTIILFLLSLIILVSLTASVLAKVKGPVVDKVYINVKMKEEIGLKDAAEGITDIFFWPVNGPTIFGLDEATRDKLEIYSTPSGSWSININPIPNAAPYLVEVEGKEYFNPFAIRKIRFALNDLINRKYVVDEILGGAGGPMFTMATPGQPGTYKYNLVATQMGMTPEGNEGKALEEINAALEEAAVLTDLEGRLTKEGEWWTFDNEPITVKFLIRVDDPQGRLKEGEYIAQQIEKSGIKVERLIWDRVKCIETSYFSDPKDYLWHMYTESWGAAGTIAFWEDIVCETYAPWYGYMPGGAEPDKWNYENEELDIVTQKVYTGNFLTEEEYWELVLEGLRLGLEDACRIYIAYQNDYYVANKERFNKRMYYGLGDGLNRWSMVTADTKDKILRITEFSAKGGLFMSAWNPVGIDGFSDMYSLVIGEPLYDQSIFISPVSAIATPLRVVPQDIETQLHKDAESGEIVGDISVPANAVLYDSTKKEWSPVGDEVKAISKATYSFLFGNFHHGLPIGLADILYANAFIEEWITQDGDDDKYYNDPYSSNLTPNQETIKGWVINSDGTITTYFDYNFPPSEERVADWGAPWISVSASGLEVAVSWEVIEALAKLVAEGSASATAYSFSSDIGTEVDLLTPSCVKDIRAKLIEMISKNYVPASIKDYITVKEAKTRYEAAIKWIDEQGHAFIGCGPFYLDKYDPVTSYMELAAFRDAEYPFTPDHWPSIFATTIVRIDSVDIPALYLRAKEEDLTIKVQVSEVLYPEGTSKLAESGEVSAILITPTEELSYKAKFLGSGLFEAIIHPDVIKDLEEGSYTILVSALIEGAVPASAASSTVLY